MKIMNFCFNFLDGKHNTKYVSTIFTLILFTTLNSHAQFGSFDIWTDKSNYQDGDTIIISGAINNYNRFDQTAITLKITDPKNALVKIAQPVVDRDTGTFTFSYVTGGTMKASGEYTIIATYGSQQTGTFFEFDAATAVPQQAPTKARHVRFRCRGRLPPPASQCAKLRLLLKSGLSLLLAISGSQDHAAARPLFLRQQTFKCRCPLSR